MNPVIKRIINTVIVVTIAVGMPVNLYLLFAKGDENGAFGLCMGVVALYFVSKVCELATAAVQNNIE